MSADVYRAIIPEPRILLGIHLKPFCLGHLMLLHRMESVFVAEEPAAPTMEDLVAAVFVCAMTWEENLRVLRSGKMERWRFGPFVRREPVAAFMLRWQRTIGLFDLTQKIIEFADYMREGCETPLFGGASGEGKASKCPLPQRAKVKLLRELNLTLSEVMNRPWGECVWDYLTLSDMDGAIELETEASLDDFQKAADDFWLKMEKEGQCQARN
jgi:hypothetical protein